MSSRSIEIHDLSEGLDRQALRRVKQRFLHLNRERYQRALSGLTLRQQQFLSLLPLFFHLNHSRLPGYVSHKAPSGIACYQPNKDEVRRAQVQARGFQYKRDLAERRIDIEALFAMGSLGSMAQSRNSDLDVWVCYRPRLTAPALGELEKKCEALAQWARTSLRMEVHFFLMDSRCFREKSLGALSSDGSGSAQQALLLDEFYRTAIWLAGKTPLWWLVPVEREADYDAYASRMLRQRYVSADEVIDFGGVPKTPVGEFVGAGIWQLYKGIEAPYKALLKLLLLEVYAADDGARPLALDFKAEVYARDPNPDRLDPYRMVYQRIADYLHRRGHSERLELVRRCLYFKVARPLTQGSGTPNWQDEQLRQLTEQWQWPSYYLHLLDSRRHWKAPDVMDERHFLVRELANSYRLIRRLSQSHPDPVQIKNDELTVLGRKLHAAFNRQVTETGAKIEWLNPGISDDLQESALCFVEESEPDRPHSPHSGRWLVYRGTSQERTLALRPPLQKTPGFLPLYLWCYCNRMLDADTRVEIESPRWRLNEVQRRQLLEIFRQWLPLPLSFGSHEQFQKPAEPAQLLVLLNLGVEPLALNERGLQLVSNRDDPLDYSGLRENLLRSADLVQVNSWGEVFCQRFEQAPLEELLLHCFRLAPPGRGKPPPLTIRCLSQGQGHGLAERLQRLWQDLLESCYTPLSSAVTGHPRYLLETAQGYLVLQPSRQPPEISRFASYPDLSRALAKPRHTYDPLRIDRQALAGRSLKLLCDVAREPGVYTLFEIDGHWARLTLMDENASLCSTLVPFTSRRRLLWSLYSFIRSVQTRRPARFKDVPLSRLIYFFERPAGAGHLEPRTVNRGHRPSPMLGIRVSAYRDEQGRSSYRLSFGGRSFSGPEKSETLFRDLADHVIRRHPGAGFGHCHVVGLSLFGQEERRPAPLIHQLRVKADVERKLSLALRQLTRS